MNVLIDLINFKIISCIQYSWSVSFVLELIVCSNFSQRFLPSEFGVDVDRVHCVEPAKSAFAIKVQIRRAIEAEGIPYTFVSANCFAGYFLPSLVQPGLSAPPRDKVAIFGDGTPKGNCYKFLKNLIEKNHNLLTICYFCHHFSKFLFSHITQRKQTPHQAKWWKTNQMVLIVGHWIKPINPHPFIKIHSSLQTLTRLMNSSVMHLELERNFDLLTPNFQWFFPFLFLA